MPSSIENIRTDLFQDFLPHIRLIKSLGEGTFAQVFLIFDEKQKIYLAVKKISLFGLNDYQRKLVLNEAKILSSIQHPNIIRFHSCLYDNLQENVYIFMEYAKQGDLLNLIYKSQMERQYLNEKIIWKIVSDIAQALNYLHSNNIIHRDVKPGNILQQGSAFKLADMNVSKIQQNGRKTCTNVGTPSYTSPQVAKKQFYNEKCDIWSLGVVIYELCCLKNPFTNESLRNLSMRNDKSLDLTFDRIPLYYSRGLGDLIKGMLRKNPEERITIKQILHICQSQGMSVGPISSNTEIVEFKTIIFPSCSQRWVNLVQNGQKKKQDLDLTIDEVLKQSELQLVSAIHKDYFISDIKQKYQDKKQIYSIKLIEDQYCLSSIKTKKDILKNNDKNVAKINNFIENQYGTIKKPMHFILDQHRFTSSQDKENTRQKGVSTDRYRKFQRQSSRPKVGISRSKQKKHNQYGFKFIKLSKDLPNLHS